MTVLRSGAVLTNVLGFSDVGREGSLWRSFERNARSLIDIYDTNSLWRSMGRGSITPDRVPSNR